MRENRIISMPIKDVVGAQAPKGEQVLFQYQKTVAADRKDTRQKVTVPLTGNPETGASVREGLFDPQNASITELTSVIIDLGKGKKNEEKVLGFKRIRRGKAIKLLREQKRIGVVAFTEVSGFSRRQIEAIESGKRDLTLEELNRFIKIFDDPSDTFDTTLDELKRELEGKNPQERVTGKGQQLSILVDTIGSRQLLASLINKTKGAVDYMLSNSETISVEDMDVLLGHAQNKYHEKNEACKILKVEAVEMKDLQKRRTGILLGGAISTLRNNCGFIQEDFIMLLDLGFSKTKISEIESGKRKIKESELVRIIETFKAYGATDESIEMQMLEAALPEKKREFTEDISPEMERAWVLFGEIMDKLTTPRITLNELAQSVNQSADLFERFQNGEIIDLDAALILEALDYYSADPKIIELQEMLHKDEVKKKWMRTLLLPEIKGGTLVRYLRLSTYLSENAFAEKAQVSPTMIKSSEGEKHSLIEPSLNKLIAASSVGQLGSDSLPAQFCRLKYYGINPMTREELEHCDEEVFIAYIRTLKGVAKEETRKQLRKIHDPVKALISFLHLDQEDEHDAALIKVTEQKIHGEEGTNLSEDIYEKAVSGRYLFAKHVAKVTPYRSTIEEVAMKAQIRDMHSGEAIKHVRGKGKTLADLGRELAHSSEAIYRVEIGQHIAEDYILAHIMFGLGYDIHHPLTMVILARAEKERNDRDAKVAQARRARKM